jgi:hypothetical protein
MADSVKLSKEMIQQLADQNKGNAKKMASPFDKMMVSVDNLKENIGVALMPIIDLMIPKIQEMVDAFGKPGSPESKSLKEMGDSLLQVFTDIDNLSKSISGDTAIVAFLKAVRNFALGTSYVLESLMAVIDQFQDKAFDPKKYPTLYAVAKGSKERWTGKDVFATNRLSPGAKQAITNYNKNSGVTININGVVGDKVAVGKAVNEALHAYKKTNGGL